MPPFHKLYGKLQKLISGENELVVENDTTPAKTEVVQQPETTPDRLTSSRAPRLVEGEDFYYEGQLMVLTAHFLTKRGYCCETGCRHCPYGFKRTPKNR